MDKSIFLELYPIIFLNKINACKNQKCVYIGKSIDLLIIFSECLNSGDENSPVKFVCNGRKPMAYAKETGRE